jgi:integrase
MPKSMPKSAKIMSNYLYKQKNSSFYSVRLIPTKNQIHLGAREYRKTLGTADRRLAQLYAAPLIAQKLSEWHALSHDYQTISGIAISSVLTEQIIEHICVARTLSVLQSDDDERMAADGVSDDDFAEITELCESTDVAVRGVLARGAKSVFFDDFVELLEDWMLTLGYAISRQDVLFPALIRRFAATEKEAFASLTARNSGDAVPTPPLPVTTSNQNGSRLSDVLPHYTDYKEKTVVPKTFSTHINALNAFISYKNDALLDTIKSVDIFMFFEHQVVSKTWSAAYIAKTVKTIFVMFFDVAISRSLMSIANPAKVVLIPTVTKLEAIARTNPRSPYSSVHLSKIYAGFWYDINEKQQIKGKMRDDVGLRYFGPLLSMCHGVRVRELVQLRVGDILFENNDVFLNFTLELDENTTETCTPERSFKNLYTKRKLPVHKLLLAQGFEKFVMDMQTRFSPDSPLFPSAVPEPGGSLPMWGRAYEQGFLRYARDKLKFGSGYGNHSFRHAFEDRIRAAKTEQHWPDGVSQYLSGRKPSTSVEGSAAFYGVGYNATQVRKYLDTIEFSDVVLPLPYQEWVLTRD